MLFPPFTSAVTAAITATDETVADTATIDKTAVNTSISAVGTPFVDAVAPQQSTPCSRMRAADGVTRIALSDVRVGDDLPSVIALSAASDMAYLAEADSDATLKQSPRLGTLLTQHALDTFTRPNIRGHRAGGADWSPRFCVIEPWNVHENPQHKNKTLDSSFAATLTAADEQAGLQLRTELEALPGGSLRIRHTLTNLAAAPYELEGLEVHVPLPDDMTEILDFTGRHERERQPQRHRIADGAWLREFRRGKPGFEGISLFIGTPGFTFQSGRVFSVQTAWSGNTVVCIDRDATTPAGVSAGELLLPGEIALQQGESYSTPWVIVTASEAGLDPLMRSLHTWQRQLSAHPAVQPVTLNVWEAVTFHQDSAVLQDIARRAAALGVERYVLDDGWFHLRRDDTAGLGDWWVDPEVWPQGLTPLIDEVHRLGMSFGLWFEPEMVNPRSQVLQEHPEWAMRGGEREPLLQRHQLVLDLTNPAAFAHVLEQMSAVLRTYAIDYVKWDHNRDLLEAGSAARGGAPAVHEQTLAYYRLLDTLRERFPHVQWESCASGGGRIDMGVVERVSRFWGSDMTDALSRQGIQRWTVQNVAPEYIGAHVSQPCSQQSHRAFSLNFRAATAALYGFGIEWDIRHASEQELEELQRWIAWYKEQRALLHSGDYFRCDVASDASGVSGACASSCGYGDGSASGEAVIGYGVVAPDASRAVLVHAQVAEAASERGSWLRVPGLDPSASYQATWASVTDLDAPRQQFDAAGPLGDHVVTGAYLAHAGIWFPRCRPASARIIMIQRVQ